MTTDKPEPLTVGASLIFLGMQAAIFKATKSADLNQLGKTLEEIAALIRSLDERARKAERNFEQAAACHKEALGWHNQAKAQVAEQAKEIAELKEQVMAFAAENAAFRLNEAWRREHGR